MEKSEMDFRIPKSVMWIFVLLCYLVSVNWIWPIVGEDNILYRTFLSFIMQTLVIVLFISDMVRSDIYERATSILLTIFIPLIGMPLYLLRKKKLIDLQKKKKKFQSVEL